MAHYRVWKLATNQPLYHRIWLRNIHTYVSYQNYRKKQQMKWGGELVLYFMAVEELAADAFQDLLPDSTEDGSDSDHRSIIYVPRMSGGNGRRC
ncbi:hypothetical protein BUE80_DR000637 [Diplocarpon rosae]|nr:hypothetical protein BUE80_DR000637 [Diplocarpon rosae]